MEQGKTEVLKGTLDMLILKVVAMGPIHGYAISQRIQQISRDFFQVQEGSLYPALYRLKTADCCKPSGKKRKRAGRLSSIRLRARDESA
jgi:DNA-binding PadR family transcriptional regulator